MTSWDPIVRRLSKAAKASKRPGIVQSTSYGTPSLAVNGKSFIRIKDDETIVVRLSMAEKEFLMEAAPEIYFQTDHYIGWPTVLVRLKAASDAELTACVIRGWAHMAPKKLQKEFAGGPVKAPPAKKRKSAVKTAKRRSRRP